MDSYIIRIYRRDKDHQHRIAGLVELVQEQEQKTFADYDQLWSILASSPEGKKQQRKSRSLTGKRAARK